MSPIRYVRDITCPMLIIHSENDLRCPISQAEELFVALRLLGKDVTFYRFPGESHELSRSGSPVHRRQRAEIILDFFAEHPLAVITLRAPMPCAPFDEAFSSSQASISLRAIEIPGGMGGSVVAAVPLASTISVGSHTMSPLP